MTDAAAKRAAELVDVAEQAIRRHYVVRADARQQALGLSYVEIETRDLALFMVRYAAALAGASWTVDDSIRAGKVLVDLGISTAESLEPGMDRRRDALAKEFAAARIPFEIRNTVLAAALEFYRDLGKARNEAGLVDDCGSVAENALALDGAS